MNLPIWKYRRAADRELLIRRVAEEIRGGDAALASSLPEGGRWGAHVLAVRGRLAPDPANAARDTALVQISPAYFRLHGVRLLAGRSFAEDDRAGGMPVAIVNEALARKYFPGESAIGQSVRLEDQWSTIVGVVADEKDSDFFHEMTWVDVPTVFRPIAQDAPGSFSVVTRSPGALRERVAALDSEMPVGEIESMPERLSHRLAYPRFRAVLLATFASLAILLASIGLYGVLAQSVRQRSSEIGVRIALGAQPRDVVLMVVQQSAWLMVVGIGSGLAVSVLLTRFLASLLYGVKAMDPFTLCSVVLLLSTVTLVATFVPARRAAAVDPAVVLRHE